MTEIRMLDLHRLEHFAEIVRTGSFARAAKNLSISQPALSRSIQALEQSLGFPLLTRGRGSTETVPTEVGLRMLPQIEDLLHRSAELTTQFAMVSDHGESTVRIGLAPILSGAVVRDAKTLSRLADATPIELVIDRPAALMDALIDGRIEFFVSVRPPEGMPRGVEAESIRVVSPHIFVRAGHPLTALDSVTAADLSQYTRAAGSVWNANIAGLLKEPMERRHFQASLTIDNLDLLARIAETSDTVVFANFVPVNKRLVEIPFPEGTVTKSNEIFLFSLAQTVRSAQANELAGWIRAQFDRFMR